MSVIKTISLQKLSAPERIIILKSISHQYNIMNNDKVQKIIKGYKQNPYTNEMIQCLWFDKNSNDEKRNNERQNFKIQSALLLWTGRINSKIYGQKYGSHRNEITWENQGEGILEIHKTYNKCSRNLI